MKKIKGHFWLPSNPSHPSNPSTRPTRQPVKPKGGCKVTGNKERNHIQFYEGNPFKKSSQKNLNRLQIQIKNP